VAVGPGCSFIGARVPHEPPPPPTCPSAVIALDALGAALSLLPVAVGTVALIQNDSQAAVVAAAVVPPMALVAGIYIASTIYGGFARARCERMQEEAQATQSERPRARQAPRAKVTSDKPLHCALSDPDVGECFVDEARCAAAAKAAGLTCEVRTSGWCFDVTRSGGPPQTTCAPSVTDCLARRIMFAGDEDSLVTTCGAYVVEKPAEPPAP
jgi:hypothetical protein